MFFKHVSVYSSFFQLTFILLLFLFYKNLNTLVIKHPKRLYVGGFDATNVAITKLQFTGYGGELRLTKQALLF